MNLTDWYPGSIRPVRAGVYEVRGRFSFSTSFLAEYVPGEGWRGADDGKWLAFQEREWRGMASECAHGACEQQEKTV